MKIFVGDESQADLVHLVLRSYLERRLAEPAWRRALVGTSTTYHLRASKLDYTLVIGDETRLTRGRPAFADGRISGTVDGLLAFAAGKPILPLVLAGKIFAFGKPLSLLQIARLFRPEEA